MWKAAIRYFRRTAHERTSAHHLRSRVCNSQEQIGPQSLGRVVNIEPVGASYAAVTEKSPAATPHVSAFDSSVLAQLAQPEQAAPLIQRCGFARISVAYCPRGSKGRLVGEQGPLTEGMALSRSTTDATRTSYVSFGSVERGHAGREIDRSTPAEGRPQLVAIGRDIHNLRDGYGHRHDRPDRGTCRNNDFAIREADG